MGGTWPFPDGLGPTQHHCTVCKLGTVSWEGEDCGVLTATWDIFGGKAAKGCRDVPNQNTLYIYPKDDNLNGSTIGICECATQKVLTQRVGVGEINATDENRLCEEALNRDKSLRL